VGEVMDGISPPFSTVLSLEEQGLFALGYYHQRQDFFKKVAGEASVSGSDEIESEEKE
jgi:CRISPR-associated protein Csd1